MNEIKNGITRLGVITVEEFEIITGQPYSD